MDYQIQAGILPKAGSDKLTMSQYRTLCSAAALSEKQYAHCFLVLAWNCMTRSHDTGSMRYSHVSFDCDQMVIMISKSKGDPTGDLSPTVKALYSNPLQPEICPFLALGLVLLSRVVFGDLDPILGPKNEEAINAWLKGLSEVSVGQHITSHSTRKGSASYVVSLPGFVMVIAAWIRAGWRLNGVLPTYITQELAGDQTVKLELFLTAIIFLYFFAF